MAAEYKHYFFYREYHIQDADDLEIISNEELVHGLAEPSDPSPEDIGIGVNYKHVRHPDDIQNDKPHIAYQSCILDLAATNLTETCAKCQEQVKLETKNVGTALILIWVSTHRTQLFVT